MSDFFGVLPSIRPALRAARKPAARASGAREPAAQAAVPRDDAAAQDAADAQPQAPRARRATGLARKRARPLPSGDLSAMGHLLS